MPTYEYKCEACGHAFEQFQSIMAKPTRKCPKCGKAKVRRLISTGGGMIFKGSGFYITDYRSEGYKASEKADATAPVSSDSKTTADAKPAPDSKPTKESKPATAAPSASEKPAAKSESKASASKKK